MTAFASPPAGWRRRIARRCWQRCSRRWPALVITQVKEDGRASCMSRPILAHLLAAGSAAWTPLAFILVWYTGRSQGQWPSTSSTSCCAFPAWATGAGSDLVSTGLVTSWLLVGSVSSLASTTYGRVLLAKLVLFAAMLTLAAANRFWLVPNGNGQSGRRGPATKSGAAGCASCAGEQALEPAVLLSVSVLGTITRRLANESGKA